MRKQLFTLCLPVFLAAFQGSSQTQTIDRLKKQVALASNPQQRLQALFRLCEQRQSLSTDTLFRYAQAAKQLSLASEYPVQKAWADYYMANYFVKNGRLDSALLLCNGSLATLSQAGQADTEYWLKFAALKAQVLVKSNKYKDGIAVYYNTLAKAERTNDTLLQMIAKNGVGWVNMEMEQNDEALKWFYRALQTSGNPVLHRKNSNIYSNIAAIYTALNQFDSADQYVRKAIAFAREDENLFYLSNSLNILADNYIRQNKPALAEAPLKEALQIRERIGDPFYIVSDLSQLALFYAEQRQPAKGIAASNKGISIARKYGLTAKLPYLQFALAKNYKAAGDYLQYGEIMENVLSLKDSVYQQNSEEELVGLKARYNQQKQENLIIQQKLDLSRQNTVIYGGVTVGFFGIVIAGILFSNYRRRQRRIVEQLKEEEARNVQQAILTAEENERKRISADLHDNLGAYASAISANADDLMLTGDPGTSTLVSNIKNNADDILNSLNETIWVLNKTEIFLSSLCDRFKTYVARIRDSYPDMLLNINETILQDICLSPEAALNMLRIMQEAFHNAIKHSKGDSITVEITGGPAIEVSIADNGQGMVQTVNLTGHGIKNMQRRARANGWTLTLERGEVSGTIVKLSAALL
ncbi:tetratricopeptide repeat-containing sensor histidine kinase [Flavisolibacter nicotianae]|uniref:tetratricopeptide repeat-containing sensor histidine kinase n=1 Tax=Flavisolibacter nicotianae TaxID=2364882 RepID=UPI0013C49F57|nr:tetratricopeptide repeat-containing sensor histidine kinase [Flavisolibacter nicotianae]